MDLKFLFLFVFLALSAVLSLGAAADLGEFEVEPEATGSEGGQKDVRCGGKKGGKGGKKGWKG
ncbi:unnamed protein product [Nezara viridula]|uniref:Neuropeptide n=1 Tax=Nezara viridula TaxID=85310 RepID=A0A9P0HQ85_NEZVI|nr:unnamed protein product [Nezara viridula]